MFQLAEGSGAKVLTFMDVALAAGILVVHNSLAFQISELTPCGACRLRYALAKKPMTKMLIPTYSNEYQILECSIMATWCFDGDEVTNLGSQPPPSTFKVVIYHVISVSDKLLWYRPTCLWLMFLPRLLFAVWYLSSKLALSSLCNKDWIDSDIFRQFIDRFDIDCNFTVQEIRSFSACLCLFSQVEHVCLFLIKTLSNMLHSTLVKIHRPCCRWRQALISRQAFQVQVVWLSGFCSSWVLRRS